jgi:hypothetical protein
MLFIHRISTTEYFVRIWIIKKFLRNKIFNFLQVFAEFLLELFCDIDYSEFIYWTKFLNSYYFSTEFFSCHSLQVYATVEYNIEYKRSAKCISLLTRSCRDFKTRVYGVRQRRQKYFWVSLRYSQSNKSLYLDLFSEKHI